MELLLSSVLSPILPLLLRTSLPEQQLRFSLLAVTKTFCIPHSDFLCSSDFLTQPYRLRFLSPQASHASASPEWCGKGPAKRSAVVCSHDHAVHVPPLLRHRPNAAGTHAHVHILYIYTRTYLRTPVCVCSSKERAPWFKYTAIHRTRTYLYSRL